MTYAQAARRERDPVAVHTRSPRKAPSASTRWRIQHRRRTTARPTAMIWPPARPTRRPTEYRRSIRTDGDPAAPRNTSRPHEVPDGRLPAAIYHRPHPLPLPHPDQDRRARPAEPARRRRSGWSSPRPTPRRSGSRRAISCGVESRRGWIDARRASPVSGKASSLRRSTTATSTTAMAAVPTARLMPPMS